MNYNSFNLDGSKDFFVLNILSVKIKHGIYQNQYDETNILVNYRQIEDVFIKFYR